MAKEIELRYAGPNDPIYREGTTILIGGLWGRKNGQPASGTPSQPSSDGDGREDPNEPAAEDEPQSTDE